MLFRSSVLKASFHQHLSSQRHLNNSPRHQESRIGRTVEKVEPLVCNFNAAKNVSTNVRKLLLDGQDCTIQQVTDLLMRETGAVRRNPMQLIATGILSGISSYPSWNEVIIESRPPVAGGAVCVSSPLEELIKKTENNVPVCSDISRASSSNCDIGIIPIFLRWRT